MIILFERRDAIYMEFPPGVAFITYMTGTGKRTSVAVDPEMQCI